MRGSLRVSVLLIVIALLVAGAPIAPATAAPAPQSSAQVTAAATAAASASAPAPSSAPAMVPGSSPTPPAALETPAAVVATPEPARPTGALTSSLYRITVPRLGIDLLIKEGDIKRDITDQRTPENFAFHLPGTALPGQGGNTYLYAHARSGMFLSLWNARAGDEVLVFAPDGQLFPFVIRAVFPRVPPTDVTSTQATVTERLTLQTSTGPNGSDPRFVVFAFPRGW